MLCGSKHSDDARNFLARRRAKYGSYIWMMQSNSLRSLVIKNFCISLILIFSFRNRQKVDERSESTDERSSSLTVDQANHEIVRVECRPRQTD